MPTNSRTIRTAARGSFEKARQRIHDYKNRRPHRSFRLTRRRDYARSLKLPGLIAFTHSVNKTLWGYRKIFIIVGLVYAALTMVLVGIGSQETYTTLSSALQDSGTEVFQGDFSQLGQAGLLFLSIGTGGLNGTLSEAQQIYTGLISLLIWLTTIWLLRNLLAGHKVRVRDGLYSAGSPIIATFLVALVLIAQLLPIAVAAIGYGAATSTGLLTGGVEAMLFWIAAILLVTLSLYWITSTFFALIIVTLPGMYPVRALRTAGDMMVGRRLRILGRLLWMLLTLLVTWTVVLIPFILIDGGIKHLLPAIQGVPIIPVVILLIGAWSVVWSSGYVYLLYRKVVDDDAKPA